MSSSISSSDPWRRFFRLAAGTAAAAIVILYGFVVLIDPWGSLPVSLPLDRTPVTSNQRFSYPALARSPAFDSAILGTSTTRLLRPAALNPAFGARFVNLAMNDATVFEISSMLAVFNQAHPAPKFVILGIDMPWCVTGNEYRRLTPRPFPAWMYQTNRWTGYGQMFNLFAIQEAGKEFAVLTGLKAPDMGLDGYTRFVPPDDQYNPAQAATHLRDAQPSIPTGEREGPPQTWRFPALETLQADLSAFPASTRRILFFVPYNHRLLPPPNTPGDIVWNECKRRVTALAAATPHTVAVDFMRPSPITQDDDHYWDPLHYRTGVADQLAHDLTAASRGELSADYQLLSDHGP